MAEVYKAKEYGVEGFERTVAVKRILPHVAEDEEFIAMFKDTSLLSILSVRDITQRAREFQASTFLTFPPYNTVAMLYIALTLAASSLVKWVERRTRWGT